MVIAPAQAHRNTRLDAVAEDCLSRLLRTLVPPIAVVMTPTGSDGWDPS